MTWTRTITIEDLTNEDQIRVLTHQLCTTAGQLYQAEAYYESHPWIHDTADGDRYLKEIARLRKAYMRRKT